MPSEVAREWGPSGPHSGRHIRLGISQIPIKETESEKADVVRAGSSP